ncbi:translation initiation factor [Pseudidiomarina woesei]|uniref:Translation initiation factor 1 (EIF-1/SUI1) n=1 Tax=Pseudidiomarina woesei TaxID=1381080 RepID=A0A0K6H109_9GAMM|nr:Translation initiation factor 1 (eIF-1/SUI1) [Pseudidiomarina woesei]
MNSLQDQLKNLGFKASSEAPEANSADSPRNNDTPDTSVPVRIQRQTKGRKGKGVTVIFDLPAQNALLQEYASALRKLCGVGGAVKDDTIELQGDQREKAKRWLEQKGFSVKLAGG